MSIQSIQGLCLVVFMIWFVLIGAGLYAESRRTRTELDDLADRTDRLAERYRDDIAMTVAASLAANPPNPNQRSLSLIQGGGNGMD